MILPYLYILAGCLYGGAAVIRRIYLSRQFSRLPVEEQNAWRDNAAWRALSGRQSASLVFSILFLLSVAVAALGLTSVWGISGSDTFALFALLLLPPFIVGFQATGIWTRVGVFPEEAGVRGGNGAMRFYYVVLITTWAVGVIGSYILGFLSLTTFF